MNSPDKQHSEGSSALHEDYNDFEAKSDSLPQYAPPSDGWIMASETSPCSLVDASGSALLPRPQERTVVPSVGTSITESSGRHLVPGPNLGPGAGTVSSTVTRSEGSQMLCYPSDDVSSDVVVLKSSHSPVPATVRDVQDIPGRIVSSESTSGGEVYKRGSDVFDSTYVACKVEGKVSESISSRTELNAVQRPTSPQRGPGKLTREQPFVKAVYEDSHHDASTASLRKSSANGAYPLAYAMPVTPDNQAHQRSDETRYQVTKPNPDTGESKSRTSRKCSHDMRHVSGSTAQKTTETNCRRRADVPSTIATEAKARRESQLPVKDVSLVTIKESRKSTSSRSSPVASVTAKTTRNNNDVLCYLGTTTEATHKPHLSNQTDGFSTTKATRKHSNQGTQPFVPAMKLTGKTIATQCFDDCCDQATRSKATKRTNKGQVAEEFYPLSVGADRMSEPSEAAPVARKTEKVVRMIETCRENPSVEWSKGNRGLSCSKTNVIKPKALMEGSLRRGKTIDVAQEQLSKTTPPGSGSVQEKCTQSIGDTVAELLSAPLPRDVSQDVGNISEYNEKEWFVSEALGVSGAVVTPVVYEIQEDLPNLPVVLPENALQCAPGGSLVARAPPKETRNIMVTKRQLVLYPATILTFAVVMAAVLTFLFPRRVETSRQILDFALNKTAGSSTAEEPMFNLGCNTCTEDATFLHDLLSGTVDPCDNFYDFVCGPSVEKHPDGSSTRVTSNEDYTHPYEVTMYNVLQKATEEEPSLKPVQDLFRECIRLNDTENTGWGQVLELLALASLEGFPFSPPVRKSSSIWKIAAKVLRLTGAAVLLNVDVTVHPVSQHRDIVALDVPDTLVRVNGGDINEAVRSYYGIVYTSIRKLRKQFFPAVHTMQIVNFAYELEHLYLQKRRESKPRVQKLSNFPQLAAFLFEIFDGVVAPVYSGDDSEILLKYPDFTTSLLELVKNADPHTVMNLLCVRLMVHASAFIPNTDLVDLYGAFLYQTRKTLIPRWKLCVRVMGKTLPPLFLLASLTDARVQSVATDLSKMVQGIVNEVTKSLAQATFLDDAAKETAKSLVATAQCKVYGPEWVGDKNSFEEYLGSIPQVMPGHGLMSFVALHQYTFSSKLARGSDNRWTSAVFRTDCWSEDTARTIYVPVLLFNLSSSTAAQEPTVYQMPQASVRVAVCIFQMLLERADWNVWVNEESRYRMENALRCFGNQHASEDLVPLRRMENSAALQPALQHFVNTVQNLRGRAGLHLSHNRDFGPEQLFFIYLMKQYCETTESARNNGRLQNAALQNVPEFHKAFICAPRTAMNPPQKCLLWRNG